MKILLLVTAMFLVSGSQKWCNYYKEKSELFSTLAEDFAKVTLTGDALWKYCKTLRNVTIYLDNAFDDCPTIKEKKVLLKRLLIAKQVREDKCKGVY